MTRHTSPSLALDSATDPVPQLIEREDRLLALGRLAGGVAHDFNNVLAALSALLFILEDEVDDGGRPELTECFDDARGAIGRGKALAESLTTFASGNPRTKSEVDLGKAVREVVSMVRHQEPPGVESHWAIQPGVRVFASPAGMQRVVMNLCVNAFHAMPEGGRLQLRLTVARHDVAPHALLEPGRWAKLVVRDTGCGMEEATLARAFEPYFTTRSRGKGSGIGLSIVHGIVRDHAGLVQVESQLGVGTVFTVFLPALG